MPNPGAHSPKLFIAAWQKVCGPFQKGPFQSDSSLIAAIHEQESALLEFAKECPFSASQIAELRQHGSVGGAEHEVFVPENIDGNPLVWKVTRPGRWGLIRATPVEYLERLELLDLASGTNIMVEGIGTVQHGQPIIVTSMAYVHGRHPGAAALDKRLRSEGWQSIADPDQMLSYRHKIDGTVMRDAHPKNFILTKAKSLVPIDVIFTR